MSNGPLLLRRACLTTLATAMLLCQPALAAIDSTQQQVLTQAQQALRDDQASQALALLQPLEAELAGEPDYDYALGLAFLKSGDPASATLALERVLAVNPRFAGARMDLAQAYFLMENNGMAKAEFTRVLDYDPPAHVRDAVGQYLAAIAKREQDRQTKLSSYLAFAVGHDSNINNGPASGTIFVPAIGLNINLAATSRSSSDTYLRASGGAAVEHPLENGVGLYAGADLQQQLMHHDKVFDQSRAKARAGVSFGNDANKFRVGLTGEYTWVDYDDNRSVAGIEGSWVHAVNAANAVTTFANVSQVRYQSVALQSNDIDQAIAGAQLLHAFGDSGKVGYVSLFAGLEDDVRGRADGDKHLIGTCIGGQMPVQGGLTLSAASCVQGGDYKRQNAAFLQTREDVTVTARAGLSKTFDDGWTAKIDVDFTRNDSNIPIYEYDRTDVALTVRRDFR